MSFNSIVNSVSGSPFNARRQRAAFVDPRWPASLGLSQKLIVDSSVGPGSSHRVVQDYEGHTGCVNALDWSENGRRLASSGDDTKICIWEESGTRYRLTESIDTGHTNNIFDVKWAPGNPTRLFTASGDRQVRVYDIGNSSSSVVTSSNKKSWNHHSQSQSVIRVLRCHTDRVKKVQTEESDSTFLTCSEDGTVRQHDLRTHHACPTRMTVARSSATCGDPLIQYGRMMIYSISISKLRPQLLVLGGSSRWAYLHDRRMLRNEMVRDWGVELREESGFTQCVRRFGVPKREGEGEIDNTIVAAKLSDSNPRDLLVSYSDEAVYLFDTDAPTVTPLVPSRTPQDMEVERENEEEEEEEDEEEEEEANDPTTSSTVPLVYPSTTYSGHQNSQTVKSVNFVFGGSHCISGSDDGNFFIWSLRDTEPPPAAPPTTEEDNINESRKRIRSGKLVGIYHGDSNTVNVMKPHPFLPILAISGIDTDIKLFAPFVDSPPPPASASVVAPSGDDSSDAARESRDEGEGTADRGPVPRELGIGENANLIADKELIIKRNQGGVRTNRLRGMMTGAQTQAFLSLLAARLSDPNGAGGMPITAEELEDEECIVS